MKIRKSTDAQALADVEKACFGTEAWTKEMLDAVVASSVRHAFVIEHDEQALGYILLQSILGEGEVERIGVLPPFRRNNIGKKLLLEVLAAENLESCFLEVHEKNEAAKALYESCGFKTIGIRAQYYSDGGDAIMMEWKRLNNE